MIGVDIQNDFWNVGLELFEDKKYNSELYRSQKVFLNANFLEDSFLSKLHNFLNDNSGFNTEKSVSKSLEFDVVYMGSVLHLLTDKQVEVAGTRCSYLLIRLVKVAHSLLKSGGILLGQTVGAGEPIWAYRDVRGNCLSN